MAASSSSGEEPSPPAQARRIIPGPWTHEETSHLIDAYQGKWYSLKRGQLRASHWEEVAEAVRLRCGFPEQTKTSTQCRHKMEKLRKRYRTDKQKGFTDNSPWIFFKKMDLMENGPPKVSLPPPKEDSDNTTENGTANTRSLHFLMSNGKLRVPLDGRTASAARETAGDHCPDPGETDFLPRVFRSCSSSKLGFKQANPISELTSAIKSLGDGFMKLEQMKMEMMREVERMRMEMEMKRTEMIIESQQQIADVFADALYAKKKLKRMSSPDS
ncbi:Trihelix transcription factor [Nymphaea thermarum]|nr:Trihelix transcription factor [Nymphaea thermarum]